MNIKPRLLFTLGDVAGIGPEVLAKAWPELTAFCHPIVIGDVTWMRRALALVGATTDVVKIDAPDAAQVRSDCVYCIQGTAQQLHDVRVGRMQADAGRGAYDFLCAAIDWTMKRQADGTVTL